MHWGWIWDLYSSLTKPGPGSSPGLWLMCFQASVTSCCTWHSGHSWLPQAKQGWRESLTAAPPRCAWAVPWHHTAPFPFAAQGRGARLGHGVPWQGWLAQPAQVAPSQRGERTGKERWLTVRALLALLLRQQGHTQPLAWGRLLRHGLGPGEIHCIWRCSFPLHFYLVFLSFLLAPNASGDSTVPAACWEFAVQKPGEACGYRRGLWFKWWEFWGILPVFFHVCALPGGTVLGMKKSWDTDRPQWSQWNGSCVNAGKGCGKQAAKTRK